MSYLAISGLFLIACIICLVGMVNDWLGWDENWILLAGIMWLGWLIFYMM